MRSHFLSALVLASACAVPVVAPLSAQAETLRSITVNGRGEIAVPPDMASITIAVRAEAETSGEAMDQASVATAAILETVADAGIAPERVQSGAIRLNPRYSQSVLSSGQQIIGYSAFNSVEVELYELDALGGLLSAVIGDGANSIGGVRFGLQDPTEHEDAARRLAVQDALRRADLYAQAGGVVLGELVSLNEAGTSGYQPMMADTRAMEQSISAAQYDVPVAAGEITLGANVVMIFEIGD